MILAVFVIIAAMQVALHGHGIVYQYHHVTESKHDFVAPGRGQLFAMVLLFPRALRSEWMMAPPNVMWFVVLIIQYYLLVPFLLRLLHRVRPAAFLAGALVATTAANLLLIGLVSGLDRNPAAYMNHCLAPFRLFEFALGMSLGYAIVHHRERMRTLTAAPATTATLIAGGLALIIGGGLMDDGSINSAFAASIVITGVALVVLPLLTKQPGRFEATAPVRLLAWTGPFSYAVLIANEPLRLVASFLRVEAVPTGAWWLYLVVYMPITLLMARPLAKLLGITPRSLARPAESPAHVPAAAAIATAQGVA
jgi:peptidoglycan/LPS O-acetylase OafA/YrhL